LPPASVFTYNFGEDSINLKKYWTFIREPRVTNLNIAVNQTYNAIDQNFKSIKKSVGSKKILFGNSGGLDSRLIPYFARKNDIDITGFTILNKRNHLSFKTGTYIASKKISKLYNFRQHYVDWKPNNFINRLLLDIRNAPLNTCDIFKNPFEFTSNFVSNHILLNGNPHFFWGHEDWSEPICQNFDTFSDYISRLHSVSAPELKVLNKTIPIDTYANTKSVYYNFF
jgi:hypothetical protein